ncbi:hypothetical protein HYV10_00015 [Candidatus Dependentiae bacterium]|nr:hypothetical protein [Candidatus Dependentiae bacterium]
MEKKYFVSRDKFGSDVFWCLLISAIITLIKGASSLASAIGYMIPIFPIIFVLCFLWSWKKEDAQSYRARCLLNITCWFWFILSLIVTSFWLYNGIKFGFNSEAIFSLLFYIGITVLVAKKYYSLIYGEVKQE